MESAELERKHDIKVCVVLKMREVLLLCPDQRTLLSMQMADGSLFDGKVWHCKLISPTIA